MGQSVLVVDDDPTVSDVVRRYLEQAGCRVRLAADGGSGLAAVDAERPDLVVLDLMMPGMNGLEVCKLLRADARTGRVPIIMLTAKAAETDKIVGLEMGADDYITKPFSVRELLARVRAVLRRSDPAPPANGIIRRGRLVIDVSSHEVTWAAQRVQLTATEFRILEYLATRPGRVLSRNDIIDTALGRDVAVFQRTIDVHITALRKKLGAGGAHIETVRGFGYKWSDSPVDA